MRTLILLVAALHFGCAAPKRKPASVTLDDESLRGASCPALGPNAPLAASAQCKAGEANACEADCESERAYGCFMRALLYEDAEDDVAAGKHYRRACELGAPIGCTNFGAQIFSGVSKADPKCALSLFEAACRAGESFGCGMVGRAYAEGYAMTPDPARARKILEAACKQGGGFPCHWLGMYLRKGTFGDPDEATARAAFERACATGFKPSCAEVDAGEKAPDTKL